MIAPPTLPTSTLSDGDSESDWDEDDDYTSRKINIKIRPISQNDPNNKICASVDELRASVGTWKSMANVTLSRPNSRRHHQSTLQLNNVIDTPNLLHPSASSSTLQSIVKPANELSSVSRVFKSSPVAFAVQETINVRCDTSTNQTQACLVSRLKMAVPLDFNRDSQASLPSRDLSIDFSTTKPWSALSLNQNFAIAATDAAIGMSFAEQPLRLKLDTKSIDEHLHQHTPINGLNYCVLPELMSYTLSQSSDLLPFSVKAYWMPADGQIKCCINISASEQTSLLDSDVTDIAVSTHVNGLVYTQESNPPAIWDSTQSKLTWKFNDFTELRTNLENGCRAKIASNPPSPLSMGEVDVTFKIAGKSLSGATIDLGRSSEGQFRIARLKREVRTGVFRCVPMFCAGNESK